MKKGNLTIVRHSENTKPPFEQVYEKYYPGVLAYITKKVDNRESAEDLCSEAFLYCYSHYDEFDPQKSAVSTWLYLVVNSRIKNYYRDTRVFADIEPLINVIPDDAQELEHAVYLQQLREQLAAAIATLPEKQQKIVIMSYFQNKSSGEIADALGLTPGNVRVMLSRALNKLEAQCQFLKI